MQNNKLIFIAIIALFLSACSNNDDDMKEDFQINTPHSFELMQIFDGHGALEDAWNCLKGSEVDARLEKTVNANMNGFVSFSYCSTYILKNEYHVMPKLLGTDLQKTLGLLLNTDNRHNKSTYSFYDKSGVEYTDNFFHFLDKLSDKDPKIGEGNAIILLSKTLSRMVETNTPGELKKDMQDLINDINDPEFQDDIIDLSKLQGRLLIQSDKPMWINTRTEKPLSYDEIDPTEEHHRNLDIGNAVEGVNALTLWLNRIMRDPETREAIHAIVKDFGDTFDPGPDADNSSKLRKLICDLEDHFTEGGEIYDTDPIFNIDTDSVYANAELGESLREAFPYIAQLFMRSDRPNSLISDVNGDKVYPLRMMMENLKKIQWNPEEADIERSLSNLMRHDIFGRDRTTDPEAYHISYLEHILFFCAVAVNSGWKDGGKTGEITDLSSPNYNHGHGDAVGGLTVNDLMFAAKTNKSFGLLGLYELSFKDDDKNHIYRSRTPFTIDNKDDYRFYFNQNYSVGRFTAGTQGDLGSPDGGINPKDENGEPILNAYRAYEPGGLEEDDAALNTITAPMRSCWLGDGPYYYAPNTPSTVKLYGKTWNVYYRPDDKIYAYVHKPENGSAVWEYIYPAENNQVLDDSVFFVGKLRKGKTHTLFTSSVDLSDGIEVSLLDFTQRLRIKMGEPENPVINEVAAFQPRLVKYTRDQIIAIINEAVGKKVCFSYDVGNKKYIQIVSPYGHLSLTNETQTPIGKFLVKGENSVTEQLNAFIAEGDASVNIKIDDEPEKSVTFDDPNLNLWTLEKVTNTLTNSEITEYVIPYRKGFIIKGKSNNPEIAKLIITNASENTDNAVEAFFGGNGDSIIRDLQRFERYKSTYLTEYLMVRLEDPAQGSKYYSVDYNKKGDMDLVQITDGQAKPFVVEQLMDENDHRRECASPEEALFRNFQWFFAERKFILPVPLHASIGNLDLLVGYLIGESNGYTGFMNTRKFRENKVWAKKAANGESYLPGDTRFILATDIILEEVASLIPVAKNLLNGEFVADLLFNDLLVEYGAAFTGILASYSPGIYRLGLPVAPKMHHGYDAQGNEVADYLVGPQEFQVGDEIWKNRNAVLPVIESLLAGIHKHTKLGYESEDQNLKESRKSGFKQVLDMVPLLLKPLMYYQKDEGSYPHNSYKPILVDDHWFLKSSGDFYSNANPPTEWFGSDYELRYYLPAMKKTLVNMLIDTDMTDPKKRCDGVLPEIEDTKILTNTFKLFMNDVNDTADFCRATEQIISAIKFTKGEITKINEGKASKDLKYQKIGSYKKIKFPDWMFATGIESTVDKYGAYTEFENVRKYEDLILDEALDSLVGKDFIDDKHDGYGLAKYPDDKPHEEDWEDFKKTIDIMAALFHEDSKYSTTQDILNFLDAILAKERLYTSEELSGLSYSLGKLFAYYQDSPKDEEKRWIYQGYTKDIHGVDFNDTYNIMKLRLPKIHDIIKDDTGDHYHSMLTISADLFKKDALMEYLLDTVIETDCVDSGWEDVFIDLHDFTGDAEIVEPNSQLWSTLTDLLNDLAKAADESKDGSTLKKIYEKYGFQVN